MILNILCCDPEQPRFSRDLVDSIESLSESIAVQTKSRFLFANVKKFTKWNLSSDASTT